MRPRIAVFGLGHGTKHATDLTETSYGELVAICDRNPEKEQAATRLGARFYTNYRTLLDNEKLDGVIVALPNDVHLDAGLECARRGLHILMEKPIAPTLEEADELIEAVNRSGVKMLVGHHRRFSAKLRAVRDIIARGEIGDLVGVSVTWAMKKPDDYYTGKRRWHAKAEQGGGPLLINVVHDVDDLRFTCGEISSVFAYVANKIRGVDPEFTAEDTVAISLTLRNGALATIFATDTSPSLWAYECTAQENPAFWPSNENCYLFFGTKAAIAFPRMLKVYYPGPGEGHWMTAVRVERIEVPYADPMTEELAHFCRLITGEDAEIVTPGQDGRRTLEIILAIKESAKTGGPVAV